MACVDCCLGPIATASLTNVCTSRCTSIVVRVLSARLSIVNLSDGGELPGEIIGGLEPTFGGIEFEFGRGEMSRQLSLVVHQGPTVSSVVAPNGFEPTKAVACGEILGCCIGS